MDPFVSPSGPQPPFEDAVEVLREDLVESVHQASAALVDAEGNLSAFLGDPRRKILFRSAQKFLQAIPFFQEGVNGALGLSPEEEAITMGSHSGQEDHVRAVKGILDKAGLSEDDLGCGRHRPFHKPTSRELGEAYTKLHNSCSGKHAMMLATCRHMGWDIPTYLETDHPLQVRIRDATALVAGLPPNELDVVPDGCSAPVHAMPLQSIARCYAALAASWNWAKGAEESKTEGPSAPPIERPGHIPKELCITLSYMAQLHLDHPFHIAGDGRMDTEVMLAGNRLGPRVVCKVGGETVHGTGLMREGLGLAYKIGDGGFRAAGPVLVSTLVQLGVLDDLVEEERKIAQDAPGPTGDGPSLLRWLNPRIRTYPGTVVGELRPCFQLYRRVDRNVLEARGIGLP